LEKNIYFKPKVLPFFLKFFKKKNKKN